MACFSSQHPVKGAYGILWFTAKPQLCCLECVYSEIWEEPFIRLQFDRKTNIRKLVANMTSKTKMDYFKDQVSQWKKKESKHRDDQLINPFSDWDGASHRVKLDKNDPNYGKPIKGSLTEIRGKQAQDHVFGEILELTMTIDDIGELQPDGTKTITFGKLFKSYLRVSNKVVGILLRARKRKYVSFEGEMLYQGRDENVVITLHDVPEDTRVWQYVPSFMTGGFE